MRNRPAINTPNQQLDLNLGPLTAGCAVLTLAQQPRPSGPRLPASFCSASSASYVGPLRGQCCSLTPDFSPKRKPGVTYCH